MPKKTKTVVKSYEARCTHGGVAFYAGTTLEEARQFRYHSSYHGRCPEGSHELAKMTITTVREVLPTKKGKR